MFDDIKERIINLFTSRLTILTLVFLMLGAILVHRCFQLQIVNGEKYLDDYMLKIEKTRTIPGTRGVIYDRNGKILAFNKLAYSVKIEDVYESNKYKNVNMNDTIMKMIKMIEKNGDHIISDFKVIVDENGEFAFSVEGTSLLRFLADVYGHKTIDELTDEEMKSTADDIMEYLSRPNKDGFAIGGYKDPEDKKSDFICGKGYTMQDWLKLVTIRYDMKLTSYRKYMGTIVASNVSSKTVAVIMENAEELPGVSIVEDTVRHYNDSKYFAHMLGYTGKISSEELAELNDKIYQETGVEEKYSLNDVVGKGGIESYMETYLQGSKGYEKVIVDVTGKVIQTLESEDAEPGNDVYLTIDRDLTIVVYNIVEQKLAGLVSSKIINDKEFHLSPNASSSDIKIPIYDVYFATINNSIIDTNHFTSKKAKDVERKVYDLYCTYKEGVYQSIRKELMETHTPYNQLNEENKVYQSNIVALLKKNGVILKDLVNNDDPTQKAWAEEEVISLSEYLKYCIAQNWIDVTKLEIEEQYPDSSQIFASLTDKIIESIDKNSEFQKKFYKYMLLKDYISGTDICKLLCEQNACEVSIEDEDRLYKGTISAYDFMKNRIDQLDITPAQLALDPCNASVVITDVHTGDVLAMVSYPGYDNNKMANSVDAAYYAKLSVDKSNPQYNFATQYKAAPGSTFKIVSATTGLMEGVIDLNDTISCLGTYTSIEPNAKCWKKYGHGPENVTSAIKDSCNYFFYEVGYRLSTRNGTYDEQAGLDAFYKYADMFGLTDKSGVEISEASPEVSTKDPVRSAIGQGTNSYTTVGLARYVSTIANGGTCYNLTLLDKVTDSQGNTLVEYAPQVRSTVEIPGFYWDAMHLGMRQVVENKSYFGDLAVHVAGKTGTAEQIKSRPSHALFVCYAPYEQPEIGIATRIPFGYSSDYAAQVTRDVVKYYYGLAEENDIVTGVADTPDGGVSNEM